MDAKGPGISQHKKKREKGNNTETERTKYGGVCSTGEILVTRDSSLGLRRRADDGGER